MSAFDICSLKNLNLRAISLHLLICAASRSEQENNTVKTTTLEHLVT
jgi:hypothetical protein